ncbi:putative zinc-binding metallopeptidase [Glaciecola sp. MF2-115]|uniref:zinc-binding metallopeptidase family protein n=1 Tax=Glaciecola sp. MF2-115 TaxID=3384827 RepID=UPI0039A26CF4
MKTFTCQCGNTLHFANTKCVQCGLFLGFIPDVRQLSAFTKTSNNAMLASNNGKLYKPCKNYSVQDVCNWMVELDDPNELCVSCRLTETIPNLDENDNRQLWFLLEKAKRSFLYSVIKLQLPISSRTEDPENGLGFDFLQDQTEDEFGNELTIKNFVTTGHSNGLITININEANPAKRIKLREKMNESYRTLLGHFRHESGHYYWDRLIRDSDHLSEFRELFGDETLDYQSAMNNYYANGPAANWQSVWISAYATMHPWEDWAETWAHYLHMVDTLETANNFDLSISNIEIVSPYTATKTHSKLDTEISFSKLYNDWCALTGVINSLNRSMGMDDAYPFVISITALNKLRFVHQVIMERSEIA